MITLDIPQDDQLLAAVGKISIRHGQLDHVLRMTIKSITGLPFNEVFEATRRQGSRELRIRVKKLAKQRLGEGKALIGLEALLDRSQRATDKRNEKLHRVWAYNLEGDAVTRDEEHNWNPIPEIAELEKIATELADIAYRLNHARLDGFLCQALERAHPLR